MRVKNKAVHFSLGSVQTMEINMKESNFGEAALMQAYAPQRQRYSFSSADIVPFFSMRKLRLVFNELAEKESFEYQDFEAFKHHVLSAVAPQLELSKWQAIAARR